MISAANSIAAQGSVEQKISDDLKEKTRFTRSRNFVNVIIHPQKEWSNDLNAELTIRNLKQKSAFKNFAFRAVRLRAEDVEAIAAREDVSYVSLDREVELLGHATTTTGASQVRSLSSANNYLGGNGVGIAVLDSGIDVNHLSFADPSTGGSRVIYSQDFTGEGRTDDQYGHGTHVAAIAAGNSLIANGTYEGIAPKAHLINLRVLNTLGRGQVSKLLEALDWILTNRTNTAYNIRVVNLSLGTVALDSYTNDPLCLAVRGLVNAGIVVVAAAGNEGKNNLGQKVYGQIHSPGNDPSVITVGATNTRGTDARADDVITSFSSRGPTRSFWTDSNGVKRYDNLIKPDLVAPGNKVINAQSLNNHLVSRHPLLDAHVSSQANQKMMYLSGTSMSTPAVAGAAALMFEVNPKLTPNLVKTILMYTAQALPNFNHFEQGAGQLNIDGAVRLAKIVRQDLSADTPLSDPLLIGAAPAPTSLVADQTFLWSQGVILDYSYMFGSDIVDKYQKIFGLGYILADATIELNSAITSNSSPTSNMSTGGIGTLNSNTLILNGSLMTDGITIGNSILTLNGVSISNGTFFLSPGDLMGDGILLGDGDLMGDGVLLGDNVLTGNSALMGDAPLTGNALVE